MTITPAGNSRISRPAAWLRTEPPCQAVSGVQPSRRRLAPQQAQLLAADAAPQSVRAPACFWEAWREPILPAHRGMRASRDTTWAIHNACTRKDTRFLYPVRLGAGAIGTEAHTQACAPLIWLIRLVLLPEIREEVRYCRHLRRRALHRRLHQDSPFPNPLPRSACREGMRYAFFGKNLSHGPIQASPA